MTRVSVLIPYFQGRRALLERCLWLLKRQTHSNYSVYILDDGSDEEIDNLCDGKLIKYVKVRDAGAAPRSSNRAWRYGYELCDGEFIVLTHPEYMSPVNAVDLLLDAYDGSARVGPIAYALSPRAQTHIDEIDWKSDLDNLQRIENFWNIRTPWTWTNRRSTEWYHHFAFTGQSREDWDLFGFIPDTEKRGMNDSWLVKLEQRYNRIPKRADFCVYHQHHRRTEDGTPLNMSVRVKRIADNVEHY